MKTYGFVRRLLTPILFSAILLVSFVSLAHPVVAKQCNSKFKYRTSELLYHIYEVSDPDGILFIQVWTIDPKTGYYIKVDPKSGDYVWDSAKGELRIVRGLISQWEVVVDITDGEKTTDAWKITKNDPGNYKKIYPGFGGIVVPVDKLSLLAPYIGLASTIIVAAVASVIYIKRVKRKKEKQ